MTEDKLNPEKGNLVPMWNNKTAKFPFNNRGFADGDGDDAAAAEAR